MPTLPGLRELLKKNNFWCYERIRAEIDFYTFDGRMLIQYVQEEGIKCFELRINFVKEVNRATEQVKGHRKSCGVRTQSSDVFGFASRTTYPQGNLN